MANTIQIIADSNRRTVVILTGNSTEGPVAKVVAQNLAYAMNTNLVTANTGNGFQGNALPFYPLAIRKIDFAVTSSSSEEYITLYWEAPGYQNTTIVQLSGTGEFNLQDPGGAVLIPNWNANSNGNIGLSTAGFNAANSSYTIILELRKMTTGGANVAWSQGQERDPASFNFPPYNR